MPGKLSATVVIEIQTNAATVWNGLTDPGMIKRYFFGTEASSDYTKGSPIYFRGEWEGKAYEDKGTILDVAENSLLRYNYWSSMSGTPDIPENYAVITYTLREKGNSTLLTIQQDGISTEEQKSHSEKNWEMIMGGLKKILEQ
ncbi:MAG: SRPBCC family protein [Bacteroidota bacterium]|jgi:uncharacterized protein YndB with AHSA1/START domain